MEITIYSKTICPNCTYAKNYLKQNNVPFTEVNLDDDVVRQAFYAKCGEGVRSVPQIFVDDVRIGGLRELQASDVVARHKAASTPTLDWE